MTPNYARTKRACYTAYFTMSSIFSLPPLLFVTLRNMYGISYTLLGTLVLVNFCTQLGVDLLFTAFSKRFNPGKIVRVMPLVTSLGLILYAVTPMLFPAHAYVGLLIGTVIFSVAAGLSEVLLSPTIAALPSDTPDRDMSMLHSLYAFGVFTVVVISTLFLRVFGDENWMYLTLFLALWPVIAAVMFARSPMPDMSISESQGRPTEKAKHRAVSIALCVACIFFGACAENGMSNWISGFLENALHVDKTLGDMVGMAGFAILLGLVRIGYAKWGRHIHHVLLGGMIGAVVCYLVAGLVPGTIPALVACMLAGVCTSMLWPGTLILMEEHIPGVGVAAYALMAAGGDLGASVSPQLMGMVMDWVAKTDLAHQLGATLHLSPEQVGMKAAMLAGALFPILGALLLVGMIRFFRANRSSVAAKQ